MKIKVEPRQIGQDHYFLLYAPEDGRELVIGKEWNREVASRALNILVRDYGMTRHNIRFVF